MAKPPNKGKTGSDHFQTPAYAVAPLVKYLPPGCRIWESACGKGNIANYLQERGFVVIRSDVETGHDFYKYEPAIIPDVIVTNPPYSGRNKEKFLSRCYELKKPFALLLPVDSLGGQARQDMYREYGIQILMLGGRINFETPSGKGSGSWFDTAWFTWGLNLPSQIVFDRIEK